MSSEQLRQAVRAELLLTARSLLKVLKRTLGRNRAMSDEQSLQSATGQLIAHGS